MSVKINKLPGIKLKEDEMYSLIGLVEDRPQAKYDFAAGTTISKFLIGLKEGKLLGRKCPKCGRIFVPPRSYCEWCHVATSEWVEVPQTGQIHTATITYISSKRERIAKPLVVGTIKL
ncbi:MAG: Zn-ribbon domain-containing OB-fold protein, partial [Caldisphaera sp.]|nr:Zn-ribbon domain-containing OB-fold protein [Caldisphaera sp.]